MRKLLSFTLRLSILKRDNYRCRICGADNKQSKLEVDHILPISKGGTNDASNLWTLCYDCNRGKANNMINPLTCRELAVQLSKVEYENIRGIIDEELFKRVMELEDSITHEIRIKILKIPESTYYYKLKKYRESINYYNEDYVSELQKQMLELQKKIEEVKNDKSNR